MYTHDSDRDHTTTSSAAVAAEPRSNSAAWLRVAAVLLGLAVASVFVIDGSRAAFSDTTGNQANSLASGTVVLTDDDDDTKMFNLTGLNGGQTVERCINVTYSGTLTSDVKMYGAVTGSGLAPGLATTVDVGTGATGGTGFSCTGFTGGTNVFTGTLAAFGSSHDSYGNGVTGFANATNSTTKSYKIAVTVSNDGSYQGKTASVDFTWEAQGQNG